MKVTKYVLVSQGIAIWETLDKAAAEAYMKSENDDWNAYCQDCYDNYERPADNEIFLYDEEIDIKDLKINIKAHWEYFEEDNCYLCSNCRSSALNDYKGQSTNSSFCPHCGAEMDMNWVDELSNIN